MLFSSRPVFGLENAVFRVDVVRTLLKILLIPALVISANACNKGEDPSLATSSDTAKTDADKDQPPKPMPAAT